MWKSTVADVKECLASKVHAQLFLKPATAAKSFSGFVAHGPVDEMVCLLEDTTVFPSVGPHAEVYCGEVVEMNSEYAVYVIDGQVRATCHYMCMKSTCKCKGGDEAVGGSPSVELDRAVVDEAVGLLSSTAETSDVTAYRADFALMRQPGDDTAWTTGLVEVNDGYVAGRYEDMPVDDFVDMILSRFASLRGYSCWECVLRFAPTTISHEYWTESTQAEL